MTPMDFAKGFLSVLSTKGFDKMDKLDVHSETGRTALNAAFTVVDDTVNTFTGNAAKSPRYRDWLKIKNAINPGPWGEFSGFRHNMCLALIEMRKLYNQEPFVVAKEQAPKTLSTYNKCDRTVIENAAKAFIASSKKGKKTTLSDVSTDNDPMKLLVK